MCYTCYARRESSLVSFPQWSPYRSVNFYATCVLLRKECFFFFNDTATTEIYTLSLHDALPIWRPDVPSDPPCRVRGDPSSGSRSEEHTSELQSPDHLVCRLLLEKKHHQRHSGDNAASTFRNVRMTCNHPSEFDAARWQLSKPSD